MSNAANLGFAFRSPLVPPNAFMLVENLHQRKSVEASCAPQPSPRFALWACLLVARKVRFVFWLGRGCRLLDCCWARLALSLAFSLTLVADAELSGRELFCSLSTIRLDVHFPSLPGNLSLLCADLATSTLHTVRGGASSSVHVLAVYVEHDDDDDVGLGCVLEQRR